MVAELLVPRLVSTTEWVGCARALSKARLDRACGCFRFDGGGILALLSAHHPANCGSTRYRIRVASYQLAAQLRQSRGHRHCSIQCSYRVAQPAAPSHLCVLSRRRLCGRHSLSEMAAGARTIERVRNWSEFKHEFSGGRYHHFVHGPFGTRNTRRILAADGFTRELDFPHCTGSARTQMSHRQKACVLCRICVACLGGFGSLDVLQLAPPC